MHVPDTQGSRSAKVQSRGETQKRESIEHRASFECKNQESSWPIGRASTRSGAIKLLIVWCSINHGNHQPHRRPANLQQWPVGARGGRHGFGVESRWLDSQSSLGLVHCLDLSGCRLQKSTDAGDSLDLGRRRFFGGLVSMLRFVVDCR